MFTAQQIYKEYKKLLRIRKMPEFITLIPLFGIIVSALIGYGLESAWAIIPVVFFVVLHGFFGVPKCELHRHQYQKIQDVLFFNQKTLIELILHHGLQEKEIAELMRMGSGVSLKKEDNEQWWGFMSKLREHKDDLPLGIQRSLDWQLRAHGW